MMMMTTYRAFFSVNFLESINSSLRARITLSFQHQVTIHYSLKVECALYVEASCFNAKFMMVWEVIKSISKIEYMFKLSLSVINIYVQTFKSRLLHFPHVCKMMKLFLHENVLDGDVCSF